MEIYKLADRRLGAKEWTIGGYSIADIHLFRLYWRFSPPASVVYASNAAIDFVKREAQPSRVLALQLSEDAARGDPLLAYDGLMVNRVRQVIGYHGNELHRYDVLIGLEQGGRPLLLLGQRGRQRLGGHVAGLVSIRVRGLVGP